MNDLLARFRSTGLPWWIVAWTILVYAFLHVPILILSAFSFNESKSAVQWTGFTLHWYERLAERDEIVSGLLASLWVGGWSTLFSTLFGTLMALAIARHEFRGRRLIEALMYVPIVTPELIVGISTLILFATLGIDRGYTTIIIAHVAFNVSFVVVVVLARLQGMDRSLEEASMILGADEITTFWRVTVPQLLPGILSGAMLAFIMSFDDYVITSFVAGPGTSTLPMVVYTMARKTLEPSVNAISTIILVATTLLIFVSDRLGRDKPLS